MNTEEFIELKLEIFSTILSFGNKDSENQLEKIKNFFNILEIKADIKNNEKIINESPLDCDNLEQWPLGLNAPKKKPSPNSFYRWKYFDDNFSYDYSSTNETLDGRVNFNLN